MGERIDVIKAMKCVLMQGCMGFDTWLYPAVNGELLNRKWESAKLSGVNLTTPGPRPSYVSPTI